jgi:molybdopterin/thiamine biosynthesis adenylyltransferase
MRILFCGVGALGSTAVWFCRNVDAQLALVDFDRVESKNVMAQAFVKASIGKNKADALRAQLLTFFGIKADAFGVRVSETNVEALCASADLIVDAFDNAKSRRILSDYARGKGKRLVHAALSRDGTFGIVRWDERFEPDEEDKEGQATCEGGEHLPLIGVLGSSLARVIQDYVKDGTQRDVMVALGSVTTTAVTGPSAPA